MTDFVGAGHRQMVDDLHEQLRGIAAGSPGVPRIAIINGASGSGKSRIVRELYGRLQREQPAPAYWPPLQEDEDSEIGRKVIGPPIEGYIWPADSLPSFSWWPLHCEQLANGRAYETTEAVARIVERHLGPLTLAWYADAGPGGRAARQWVRAQSLLRDSGDEVGMELLGQALDHLGAAVPGLSLLRLWGTAAGRRLGEHRRQRHRLGTAIDLGAEQDTQDGEVASQTAEAMLATTGPRLPGIVVVEDIHHMPSSLVALLETLVNGGTQRPVMVIGTAWPEAHDREPYATWLREAGDRGQVRTYSAPQLELSDRVRILVETAPRTDPLLAEMLAERYTSPYALRLLLESRRIAAQVREHGAITLRPDEFSALPASIVAFHRQRWAELPERVQTAMRLAARAIEASDASTAAIPFVARIIDRAALALEVHEVAARLEDGVNPYKWFARTHGMLQFADPQLAAIAAADWSEEFSTDQSEQFLLAVRDELETYLTERLGPGGLDPDDVGVRVAAGWLLDLDPERPTRALAAAIWVIATLDVRAGLSTEACRLVQTIGVEQLVSHEPDAERRVALKRTVAEWFFRADRPQACLALINEVLDEAKSVLQPGHPLMLEIRLDLVWWTASDLTARGHTDMHRILRDLARIDEDCRGHLPADHPVALRVRSQLLRRTDFDQRVGRVIGSVGAREGTGQDRLPEWEELIGSLSRVYGAYDELTVHTRTGYASADALTPEARIRLITELANDLAAEHGPTSGWCLSTRAAQASHLAKVDPSAALALIDEVLAEVRRTWGPRSHLAVSTASRRCVVLAAVLDRLPAEERQVGAEAALGWAEALHRDAIEAFGSDSSLVATVALNVRLLSDIASNRLADESGGSYPPAVDRRALVDSVAGVVLGTADIEETVARTGVAVFIVTALEIAASASTLLMSMGRSAARRGATLPQPLPVALTAAGRDGTFSQDVASYWSATADLLWNETEPDPQWPGNVDQLAEAIDVLLSLEARQDHPFAAIVGRDIDDLVEGSVAACLVPLQIAARLTGLSLAQLLAEAVHSLVPTEDEC